MEMFWVVVERSHLSATVGLWLKIPCIHERGFLIEDDFDANIKTIKGEKHVL